MATSALVLKCLNFMTRLLAAVLILPTVLMLPKYLLF